MAKKWRLDSKLLIEYHVACRHNDRDKMAPPYEDLLHALGERVCRYFSEDYDSDKLWMHIKHSFMLASTARTIARPERPVPPCGSSNAEGQATLTEGGQPSTNTIANPEQEALDSCSEDRSRSTRHPPKKLPLPITIHDLDMAGTAVESMAVSGRHYAIRASVHRLSITLWYYDRACIVRALSFDFEKQPNILALFAYGMSSTNTRNDDYNPEPCVGPSFVFPVTPYYGSSLVGTRIMFLPIERGDPVPMFSVDKFIYVYSGLIGRGTMVYEVREDFMAEDGSQNEALKVSWPLAARPREAALISQILQAIPEWQDHLPEVTFSATYTPIELGVPRVELLRCIGISELPTERNMHVLGMLKYEKLWEVGNIGGFKKVFVDCVECKFFHLVYSSFLILFPQGHYHSYTTGRVLHGDLSENNLMFKQDEDGVKGIVNDWDMASPVDDRDEVLATNIPTGTTPFMACELLCSDAPPHLYRHDLESFFYILVWACVNYSLRKRKQLSIAKAVELWNLPERARMAKVAFLIDPYCRDEVFNYIGEEFNSVKEAWLMPLWKLFRDAFVSAPEGATLDDYDMRTYGGRITFEKFMSALGLEPRNLTRPQTDADLSA